VFNAPIRLILNESSHHAATAASRRLTGKGISQQTFNIMKKIREVDELMAAVPRARDLIREVHPEVCFYGLAFGEPMRHNKKTPGGFAERLALIAEYLPDARRRIDAALAHFPRKQVAADDILDCAVAVITAAHAGNWATVPETPETDSRGIPMEIVYLKFR
jgi:predicted RNase H-like nuclease